MPLPTSYDTAALKAFMHGTLRATADTLGWTVGDGDYDEAADDVCVALGVTAPDSVTDLALVRAMARRAVWRAVMAETATDYDTSEDGQSAKRSQMYEMAERQAERADIACEALGLQDRAAPLRSVRLVHSPDPYAPLGTAAGSEIG